MNINISTIATALDQAARHAEPLAQFSTHTPFSLAQAYEIQRVSMQRRYADGERSIGIKLGFTSRAKMQQMGVDSLIWGWLTDAMLEEDGGDVALSRYIHPRAEPEVCFLVGRAIDRPLTLLEAAEYIEAVAPAIEIIDSRYEAFKFSLEDVVADNCSSSGVVMGAWSRNLSGLDNAGVLMRLDGQLAQVGSTAAILGNPLRSVAEASKLVSEAGLSLPAGSLIMAGAATAAEALHPGVHVSVEVAGFGESAFTCR
ncbi:2-keto-4-pentenoate hydratase [Vreelandella venusta]|uniref:4-oxalocrotonate decarboxylase n=1 Tax=Vreelandella venusta TaxID=44935 RepID=A0ABX2B7Q4_9GAMM|nr:fumarylacetoacetate hydrolase family protein [Halomonas venusta]AZM94549.1 4-oxalocrotonate decarboxylase [Halomonas venusta]NPT29028.1 4-oxalocrotonate decarboxylase [Halomonas venusta]